MKTTNENDGNNENVIKNKAKMMTWWKWQTKKDNDDNAEHVEQDEK